MRKGENEKRDSLEIVFEILLIILAPCPQTRHSLNN